MRKILLGIFVASAVLVNAYVSDTQMKQPPGPAAPATIVTAGQMDAIAKKDPTTMPLSDRLTTVTDIAGEYNVAIATLHRAKPKSGGMLPNALEHSQITEVYVMQTGSATIVVGGAMTSVNPKVSDSGTIGPTFAGKEPTGAKTYNLDPGDVLIIPPNTPHYFSEVKTDEITYLNDRIDPNHVLYMPDSHRTSTLTADQIGAVPPATSGVATFIKSDEITAAANQTGRGVVQVLRVADINHGQYNIAIALLHRTPEGDQLLSHDSITEIYHILSGRATLTTGGTIDNPKVAPPNPRIGPGWSGATVSGATSVDVGPGDVAIIPPNTPHYYSKVQPDKIVYLVVRVDTHHTLSMPQEDAAAAAAAAAKQ